QPPLAVSTTAKASATTTSSATGSPTSVAPQTTAPSRQPTTAPTSPPASGTRTMTMDPAQPVFGRTLIVKYAGGVDPRSGDLIQARSPSGFTYDCDLTPGVSGQCNVGMPSREAAGTAT